LARPGGNTTGFIAFEYAIGAKWLELLKEVAPHVTRAAVLRDPTIAAGVGQFAAIQATAPFGIELSVVGLHDAAAIEPAVAAFARVANGGLIMTASPFGGNHPEVITTLAARYKLPAVYPGRYFIDAGGLMSYGSDLVSQFRSAAQYVDRILRGEKPADLPVQAPTKYELVINRKTAKALGLDVPATLLARRPSRLCRYSPKRTTPQAAPPRPSGPSTRRYRKKRAWPSSYPILADAGSCPGNCSGMEEATGAPSSFTV